MKLPHRVSSLLVAVALGACAAGPQPRPPADASPVAVVADPGRFEGQRVDWGGQIVAVHNLHNRTELEVLAYPLSSGGRPTNVGTPQGRFIAVRSGFLEPTDFAPGRLVTVSGVVGPPREGSVGEARYLYATVSAENLRLWDSYYPYQPAGVYPYGTIGVGIGSGGFYGGGVGIGLGF